MARFEIHDGWAVQAYRFALDPTPNQLRALASHPDAARFAHNHMLALVKAVADQRAAERSYGIPEGQRTSVGIGGAVGVAARAARRPPSRLPAVQVCPHAQSGAVHHRSDPDRSRPPPRQVAAARCGPYPRVDS